MRRKRTSAKPTQHALLVILGEFARTIGLTLRLQAVTVRQQDRKHSATHKVLEAFVATLAGLPHLQDLSRAGHPLDQDQAVAEAWGQAAWADYSGVSRTLQALSLKEAQAFMTVLKQINQGFLEQEIALILEQQGYLIYDGDLTGLAISKSTITYPNAAYGHMGDAIRLGYQAAVVSISSLSTVACGCRSIITLETPFPVDKQSP